jgi:hypothetical protein
MASLIIGAAFKGGFEERFAVGVVLLDLIFTQIVRDNRVRGVHWPEFATDTMELAAFLAIAMRSTKYWTLAASACALLGVMTHVVAWVDRRVGTYTYLTAIIVWTWGVMISIGVGVWGCWRDQLATKRRDALAGATLR